MEKWIEVTIWVSVSRVETVSELLDKDSEHGNLKQPTAASATLILPVATVVTRSYALRLQPGLVPLGIMVFILQAKKK